MRLNNFAFIALLFSAVASTIAADKTPDFSEAKTLLLKAIDERAFPGCAVVVGNESGAIWNAAFGHFTYENKTPVTTSTIYDLASLTKVVGTTTVYMRLSALGNIDLSERVEKFLPEFVSAAANDDEKTKRKQITIEQLLTHTGGIAGWKPIYKTVNFYADLMQAIYKTPLASDPGEKFSYSDLGMMMLGEIASRVGGKKLPELERELVFDPLNMRDTMRNPSKGLIDRIPPTERWLDKEEFVHGIVHDENSRAGGGITGHAGLFSTTEDLSKLAAELLRGLEGKSKLFPKEVVEKYIRKRGDLNRALGWAITSQRDSDKPILSKTTFGHTGFTGTSMWIDPEQKLFVILLSNRVHPTRDNGKIGRVRSELADAVVKAMSAP